MAQVRKGDPPCPPLLNLHLDTRDTAGAARILSSLRDSQTGLEWIEQPGAEHQATF